MLIERVEGAFPRLSGAARVLEVFRRLASQPDGSSLGELARGVNAPKSSVHRDLRLLRQAGLVTEVHGGRYRYSYEFFRLVFNCYEEIDEVARIRPLLLTLAHRFGETVHYAILDGGDVVYLAKIEAPGRGLKLSSAVGGRNPAYCTGVGKALLAFSCPVDDDVRRFVKDNGPLAARTPNTLIDGEALVRELKGVRKAGYALDCEESELGINCLAVPLFLGPRRLPTGAISVTALSTRMSKRDLEASVPEVRAIVTATLGDVLP